MVFKIINYVFQGSKLQFAAPDYTLDGSSVLWGGGGGDILIGTLTTIDVFKRIL